MSGRFYNGFASRNFARSNRRNPYNSRRVIRRRPVFVPVVSRNGGRRRFNSVRRTNDSNSAKRYETVQTFKVYAGALKADGLVIDLGPSVKQYNGTTLVTTALNFNGYRPVSATLEFTPLLNQTNAVSTVNAFLSTDVKTEIPKTDADMKNSTVSHKGIEWFAARRTVNKFIIPPLKHGVYETGSGAKGSGSTYEEAARIIVKPTAVPDASKDLAFGEVYLSLSVAFSAPATPVIPDSRTIEVGNGFELDVSYLAKDFDKHFIQIIFFSDFAKYFCPDYHESSRAINTWYEATKDANAFNLIDIKTVFRFSSTKYADDIYKHYVPATDDNPGHWEDITLSAISSVQIIKPVVTSVENTFLDRDHNQIHIHSTPVPVLLNNKVVPTLVNSVIDYNKFDEPEEDRTIILNSEPMPTYLTQPVVNVDSLEITDFSKFLSSLTEDKLTLTANSIPTFNKEAEGFDITKVDVTNKPLDVKVVNVPLPVDVVNKPLDVNITNQPLDVKVTNQVDVDIKNQPIDVHQVKSAGDQILGLLGSLIGFLVRDGNSITSDEITQEFLSSLVPFDLPVLSEQDLSALKSSYISN